MLPGPAVPGSCLASFHFLWAIHPIRPVLFVPWRTGLALPKPHTGLVEWSEYATLMLWREDVWGRAEWNLFFLHRKREWIFVFLFRLPYIFAQSSSRSTFHSCSGQIWKSLMFWCFLLIRLLLTFDNHAGFLSKMQRMRDDVTCLLYISHNIQDNYYSQIRLINHRIMVQFG